jgi:hypothetical protein
MRVGDLEFLGDVVFHVPDCMEPCWREQEKTWSCDLLGGF